MLPKFSLGLLLFVISITTSAQCLNQMKENLQNHAPDMVYIPGNEVVAPFYISRYEVRNRDYMIYTIWLREVYIDYPEVYKNALPDTSAYPNYFYNPAYKNFPVLGITHEQANNYCQWLTDRFNEFLLIENEILQVDPNQINEEAFTTGAYLSGQYSGMVGRNLAAPHGERRVSWYDKIFAPAFRLASKSEWNHAVKMNIENTETLDFEKLKCKKPYGKKYFLDLFYHHYIEIDYNWEGNRMEYYLEKEQGIEYNNKITPVCTNNSKIILHGISNEVNEWLADSYSNELQATEKISINPGNLSKDHLGRTPYIIMKDDKQGNPVYIKKNMPNTSFSRVEKDSANLGFRVAISALNKPTTQVYSSFEKALKNPNDVMILQIFDNKEKLPADFSVFANLRCLYIPNLDLEAAPGGMEKLTFLTECRLAGNQLNAIPSPVFKLQNLAILDLSRNKINVIPKMIEQLYSLDHLSLQQNNIENLPVETGNLKNLTVLNISYNQLKTLPQNIAGLADLKRLQAQGNELSNVAEIITQLTNIKYLDLSNNNLSEKEKEKIKKWFYAREGVEKDDYKHFLFL
jgi:hypothetical protein